MAQKPPERRMWLLVWELFKKSIVIKPNDVLGTYKGTDFLGNKYYEIGPDPQGGRRHPRRWFEPMEDENFEQELPTEWLAWLRRKRDHPPTEDEIIGNMARSKMAKDNAQAKEEVRYSGTDEVDKQKRSKQQQESDDAYRRKMGFKFPSYGDEYEIQPGSSRKK